MKLFNVYLNKDFLKIAAYRSKETPNKSVCKLVARVGTEDLEDVFFIGNHWPNEFVEPNFLYECGNLRSISVGDVIEDIEDNKFYMVDNIGFKDITMEWL